MRWLRSGPCAVRPACCTGPPARRPRERGAGSCTNHCTQQRTGVSQSSIRVEAVDCRSRGQRSSHSVSIVHTDNTEPHQPSIQLSGQVGRTSGRTPRGFRCPSGPAAQRSPSDTTAQHNTRTQGSDEVRSSRQRRKCGGAYSRTLTTNRLRLRGGSVLLESFMNRTMRANR